MNPIRARELEVIDIQDLTPGMRRITFGGAQLYSFTDEGHTIEPMRSDGFDDDIRIIFPHPVTGICPKPHLSNEGTVVWNAEVKELFRTYSVRKLDHNQGALLVDFARHGVGLAENWSAQANIGDKLWIVGPKACRPLPLDRGALLLVGDETALPAIGRGLEELPAGFPVTAIIEVAQPEHIFSLDTDADATIIWAVRSRGESFVNALAQIEDTPGFVWVAGEAGKLKQARAIVAALGVPKADAEFTGYWRDNPVKIEEDGTVSGGGYAVLEQAHELTELAPGFAIRAGVQLSLFAVLGEGVLTTAELADKLQLPPTTLERLLHYLHYLKVVEITDNMVRLSPIGREYADEESYLVRQLLHPMDRRLLALDDLATIMRSSHASGDLPRQAEEYQAFFTQWVVQPTLEATGLANPQLKISGYDLRLW